jgi:outer membrane protein
MEYQLSENKPVKKPFALYLIIGILFAGNFAALIFMWNKLKAPVQQPEVQKVVDTISPGQVKIAFVNLDSLNAQYLLIIEKSEQLEKSALAADEKLKSEVAKRKKEFDDLVLYAQKGNLPADEQATVENRLAELQNDLEQIQQREEQILMESKSSLQAELRKKLDDFTSKYAKDNGWDYIISSQSEVPLILFANPIYDLTNEIVKGLNTQYESEKQLK